MQQHRQFWIVPERLLDLGMELSIILHSHDEMCRIWGPYEDDCDEANNYVACYYRKYFEERLSYLLISIAVLLRTLDDRGLIDDDTKGEHCLQLELGRIYIKKKWEDINSLRRVCNAIIHAVEVIPPYRVRAKRVDVGELTIWRELKFFPTSILISGKLNGSPTMMELNLKVFCEIVLDVAERTR